MKSGREGGAVEGEKTEKKEGSISASSELGKNTVLNDDDLFEILVRLPASSVLRLKGVCKSWHSLTTEPSFVRRHTRHHCDEASAAARPKSMLIQCDPPIASPSLTLCIVDADVRNNRILHQDDVQMRVKTEFIDSDGESCITLKLSCDGLLCFKWPQWLNIYYICNPVTKTWTTVASAAPYTYLRGFYFHPSTGEYRLLQYFYNGLSRVQFEAGYEVATVNGGENKPWRRVYEKLCCRSDDDGGGLASGITGKLDRTLTTPYYGDAPLLMNKNLHWMPLCHEDDGIVVFDISSEKFRSISLPFENRNYSPKPALFEIGGSLCIGNPWHTEDKMELWLLKDYSNQHQQRWIKMHTITYNNEIPRSPEEEEEVVGRGAGNLLLRWEYADDSKFSLYDFKHKTCCHIHVELGLNSYPSVHYTESLVDAEKI